MGISIREISEYLVQRKNSGKREGRKLSLRLLRKLPVVDRFPSGNVILEERKIGERPTGKGIRTVISAQGALQDSLTDEWNSPSTTFDSKLKRVTITHRRSLLHR